MGGHPAEPQCHLGAWVRALSCHWHCALSLSLLYIHTCTHARDFRDFYREVPQLVPSADSTHSEGWEMASLEAAPELVGSLGIPGLRRIGS